jgi:diaminohydroxyphosphoribosylaminopyrimidine deaminase/5-amino-6-(5-phosphoribosylamino)uracil reductase
MARALALAARGVGRTHPNPPVGAVVVQRDRVIGEGFHRRVGSAHAEIVALRAAGRRAAGATLYVTLEPCTHYGRTPPCLDSVLASRVARVVIGIRDPNPRVRGRGIAALAKAGVAVTVGTLAPECREISAGYLSWIQRRRPLVVLKLAASLDGRIATATGAARWITAAPARRRAHELRNRLDAVMVGAGTVRADDPQLTCRVRGGRDPIRVVVSGSLRVPRRARLLRSRSPAPTWIITSRDASRRREATLSGAGATVIRLPGRGRVRAGAVLDELGRRGVTSVLVEGGASLAGELIRAGLVDRLILFLAPILLGGDGVPVVGSLGARNPADALKLRGLRMERVGPDLVLEATLPLPPVAL